MEQIYWHILLLWISIIITNATIFILLLKVDIIDKKK